MIIKKSLQDLSHRLQSLLCTIHPDPSPAFSAKCIFRSIRSPTVPQSVFDVLQEYKEEWYDKVKELAGDEWEDNGFVFVTETGRHTNPSAVSSWLTRVEEMSKADERNAEILDELF